MINVNYTKSEVIHKRRILGDNDLKVDEFTIKIPVSFLSDGGISKVILWNMEEFDRAYIDWRTCEFVMEVTMEHYLPEDAEACELKEFEEVV